MGDKTFCLSKLTQDENKMKTTNTPQRRKALAAIHIIKKSIGMDDDAYRDALADNFDGRRSSTLLSQAELNQWLIHFKTLQKKYVGNLDDVRNAAMIRKCEALWIELRKAGAVQDGSLEALQSFVCHTTGAAALRMADGGQLYQAIEALKKWLERVEKA